MITNDCIDIKIDRRKVCHRIGYDSDYKAPVRTLSLVNEYTKHAQQLIQPLYSYVIRDVEWARGSIALIQDSIIFKSQVIARLLEECHKVAIFVATIGEHLEEITNQLAEDGLMLKAAVLDAIGSDTVERVADFAQAEIGEIARDQGLVISPRFSPGYCDWDIGQQRMVFWAMNGSTAGVHLTGRCLMIPQKSISGIIGIGPSSNDVETYNPCKTCDRRRECRSRR